MQSCIYGVITNGTRLSNVRIDISKFQEELRKYDIRNQDLQKELNITKQMYTVQTENLIQLQQKTNHRSIRMVWKIEDNIDKLNQKFSLGKYRRK